MTCSCHLTHMNIVPEQNNMILFYLSKVKAVFDSLMHLRQKATIFHSYTHFRSLLKNN
jgi:hypothetical protein